LQVVANLRRQLRFNQRRLPDLIPDGLVVQNISLTLSVDVAGDSEILIQRIEA